MREKVGVNFRSIAPWIALGIILFTAQSCSKDRFSVDQLDSLAIYGADNAPDWSPDGSKIIFDTNRAGNWEIYSINTDGSDPTRLTCNEADDWAATWSPDETKIAFVSLRDGNREIYVMNADGSNQIRLTDNLAADAMPSWSPDGHRLAFHSRRDGNFELYAMNADGSDQTRLTENSTGDMFPCWSSEGYKIVFQSNRDGNWDIYSMDIDGSDLMRLTDNPAADVMPTWSPDGKKVAFVSGRDGNGEIYTMALDGSDLMRLTDNPAADRMPSWSPDGQKIAFETERDIDPEVYVINADGSNLVNLTDNAPVNIASGKAPVSRSELSLDEIPFRLVYESFRETDGKENWEICMINADGSDFINLTNTPEIDEMYPHASPDGHWISFVADEGEDEKSRIRNVYYMNINGSDRVKIASNAYQPCWSSDGKYIAYLPAEYPRYNPDPTANKGLEIYDLETGKAKQHPNDEIRHLWCLCWSPDGEWFMAASTGAASTGPIIAVKVDDKTMRIFPAYGCTPDISPDGKRIAWSGSGQFLNIGIIDFDSIQNWVSDLKIVITCERNYRINHMDWSPDGNYIAFSYKPEDGDDLAGMKASGSNICVCDLKTGKWTLVTTDGKHNKEPDWVPVGEGE